jgi:ribosomal protein S10
LGGRVDAVHLKDRYGEIEINARDTHGEPPDAARVGRRESRFRAALASFKRPNVTDAANVSIGSKCEELNLSKSGPVCLTKRTSMRTVASLPMGHERKYSLCAIRLFLFEFESSARR